MRAANKPRPESLEVRLGPEGCAALRDALLDGMSYRAAIPWVLEQFGQPTSLGGMCNFYEDVCVPYKAEYLRHSARVATQVADAVADEAALDTANRKLLKQQTFELLSNPNADPEERGKSAMNFVRMLAVQVAETKARTALLKAQQADQAKEVVNDATLTAEQKEARIKSLFGRTE